MARYHLTPEGPKVCSARIKCDYADKETGEQPEHYGNKAAALQAFEQENKASELPEPINLDKKRRQKEADERVADERRDQRKRLIKAKDNAVDEVIGRQHFTGTLKDLRKYSNAAIRYQNEGKPELSRGYIREVRQRLLDRFPYSPDEENFPYFSDDAREIDDALTDEEKSNELRIEDARNRIVETDRRIDQVEKILTSNGFEIENPKFGVPTGKTTLEEWQGKNAGNYCKLPDKVVPVLKDSKKFCTKCGETLFYAKISGYGEWYHPNDSRQCDKNDVVAYTGKAAPALSFATPNYECRYCGTGDPSYSTFEQKSWSDETSCSRCGGVAGFAIGD